MLTCPQRRSRPSTPQSYEVLSKGVADGIVFPLESIPGFRVDLPVERFAALVEELGACLIGQTARVAPADKRLYALRDVTGTVESIPLIASSIMSKKLAEGIDGLVLDVKVGAGAFMKDVARARALCAAMRAIGVGAGKRVTCVLTDMDAPIGTHVGNALEIAESIEVMRGGGPADTRELTVVLGAEMLLLAGVESDPAAAAARIGKSLDDGSALAVFAKIVAAQGGDPRVCDAPAAVLPRAPRYCMGAADYHGQLAPMIDLGARLGLCAPRSAVEMVEGRLIFVRAAAGHSSGGISSGGSGGGTTGPGSSTRTSSSGRATGWW